MFKPFRRRRIIMGLNVTVHGSGQLHYLLCYSYFNRIYIITLFRFAPYHNLYPQLFVALNCRIKSIAISIIIRNAENVKIKESLPFNPVTQQ